jgi:ArsR family transcriptional regulator
MAADKSLNKLETLFLALADKTRLRILNLMGEDEICVGYLVEMLGESQPKISRHLAYLRNAGVVSVRRDGKWMHYRIEEPENSFAAEVINSLLDWAGTQDQMRAERKRLEEVGGVTRKVKKAARAPRPGRIEAAPEFEPVYEAQEEDLPTEPMQQPYQRQELETYLL